MSPTVIGLFFGVGLLLVVDGVVSPPRPSPDRSDVSVMARRWGLVGPVAVGAGVVVWLVFDIAVVAVGAAVLIVVARWLMTRERGRSLSEVADLAEVIARWLENVSDKVRSASHTAESALLAASEEVTGPYGPPFHGFAEDMRVYGLDTAGQRLCEELDHPLADKAVVALLSARQSGGMPVEALGALADAAQSEMNNARRLAALLTSSHTSARLVVLFGSLLAVLALVLFRENLSVYTSVAGQVTLLVGLTIAAVSLWKVWDLSRVPPARRYLRVNKGGVA